MHRRALLAVLTALIAGVPASASAAERVDLLVGRDADLSATERRDVRADAGVRFERPLRLDDAEVVSVAKADAGTALAALEDDPDVRWAVADHVVRAQAADPYFPSQWSIANTGQTVDGVAGTPDADLDVDLAWSLGTTGVGVAVAVLDTGVEATHPDLAGRLATNPGETGAGRETNGVDDDHNGLVDDWRGWDFVEDDATPQDAQGHGTHVTGTIVAAAQNGIGVAGVAPDARVLPVRVLDALGEGSFSDILDAMDYVGDLGIPIANLSLGAETDAQPVADAAKRHPGTLFLAAAGNDGLDLETTTYAPCEADAPNVVCVGATDSRDARASFSNFGTTAVDLYAPGVSVLSTYLGGSYAFADGTSMATPNVAGTAALALALERDPELDAAALAQALRATVDLRPGLPSITGGRANAARLVASLSDDDGIPAAPAPVVEEPQPEPADETGDQPELEPQVEQPAPELPVVGGLAAPVTAPVTGARGAAGGTTGAATAPTPAAAPALRTLSAQRVPCAKGRTCARRVRLSLSASTAATASVAVERRTCRKGRCTWSAVARTTRAVSAGRSSFVLAARLRPGRHRVTVTLAAHGHAGAPRTATLTVR